MTTRVDILKEKFETIKFPSVCPVCKIENPDTTINMRTYISINQPLKEKIGEHWKLLVPVCNIHKKNIRIGRIISALLFFVMVIVSMLVFYGVWLVLGQQHWLIYSVIGIAVLSAVIYLHPKVYSAPLLIDSFSFRLLFTFRNDDLAEKFAILNGIEEVHSTMNQSRKISNDH